ncbi:hemolysin-type calcium-binding protein [Brevirhabdus pacifica]|uniref:Hemolysin-type calcium-binding protein n=1 Tax=Brevirhabdus pacifica TaxID=1267768 RepID=A0A1U7DGY7_9RHOB|nr:hemolysin-type calcium-binding protein [Brevirhabdus pacifica]OWU76692.1 hemolysin-type calcium-binding protein [Loktanella sp. 22II-4b]PJJ86127.1 Hint domain-containing protein [Brevirhabdus pacifica]
MTTGLAGTYVIRWQQAEIDGVACPSTTAVCDGATWRWSGRAIRVDGPDHVVLRGDINERLRLRRRASRSLRRLLAPELSIARPGPAFDEGDPLFDAGFVLTDGRHTYPATFIRLREGLPPLVMFNDRLPRPDVDHWVVRRVGDDAPVRRTTDFGGGVICFTESTRIDTPDGPRLVQELEAGDWVRTKDNGAQQIVWRGHRRMSGARLYAMPELRPVRIAAGALGDRRPDGDLLVSPQHRVMVRGPLARALFNEPEVLVAAEHLLNDRSVTVEYNLSETVYHHLMFDRHQVLWANGVECESFHPANTTLKTIEEDQREQLLNVFPGLEQDLMSYGEMARRDLSRSEAAILLHGIDHRH